MIRKLITFLSLIFLLFSSCKQNFNKKSDNQSNDSVLSFDSLQKLSEIKNTRIVEIDSVYLKLLTEKQIGKSNYYISIPENYKIDKTRGPDFDVYYISSKRKKDKENFSIGLYFGNFPHKFEKDSLCINEIYKSRILGNKIDWKTQNCDGHYFTQAIIKSESEENWNKYIHAYSNSNTQVDLFKTFYIFSTLKKRDKQFPFKD